SIRVASFPLMPTKSQIQLIVLINAIYLGF
ncbi:MAG: hypothetical protein ACI82O_003179, partial [Patiriisocius sp.]